MKKFRIGRDISIGKNFVEVPSVARSLGYNVFQIFISSNRRIISPERSHNDLINFKNELELHDVYMVIHSSYLINLCHPPNTTRYLNSIQSLVQDLSTSAIIGHRCLGVVIHMGKNIAELNISNNQAIRNYISGIKHALQSTPHNTTIILETGASQGSEVGSKLPDLAKIYAGLSVAEQKRIGFCIDTCHIWATGYDISSKSNVKKFIQEFDQLIGIDKITCIHFNNSKRECGSKVDRHADLNYGKIHTTGLATFAKWAKSKKIPIIMETPLDSVNPKTNHEISTDDELNLVMSWIKN